MKSFWKYFPEKNVLTWKFLFFCYWRVSHFSNARGVQFLIRNCRTAFSFLLLQIRSLLPQSCSTFSNLTDTRLPSDPVKEILNERFISKNQICIWLSISVTRRTYFIGLIVVSHNHELSFGSARGKKFNFVAILHKPVDFPGQQLKFHLNWNGKITSKMFEYNNI